MKNRNELFIVLVVIGVVGLAVIAGLNGMMLPALNQARENQCINNLSQIGKAFFQYAMSNDDWYPTSSRTSYPKWMNGDSGESLNLLFRPDKSFFGYYSDPLLPDPMIYLCPSKKGISPAQANGSLRGHVSYNWCDGLMGGNATLSPVACDGVDNHGSRGHFVRGDGSVATAVGTRSVKWTQDIKFKNNCYGNNPPTYSF
jgi:hypothetical protein